MAFSPPAPRTAPAADPAAEGIGRAALVVATAGAVLRLLPVLGVALGTLAAGPFFRFCDAYVTGPREVYDTQGNLVMFVGATLGLAALKSRRGRIAVLVPCVIWALSAALGALL